jgi:ubiquinone/menaquinone biosynthesis C-methylase UbiE
MNLLHGHQSHTHKDLAPATSGRLIGWARYYDPVVSLLTLGRRARLRARTVELARIQRGESVLEVGCGTGDVALAAKARAGVAGPVYGVDPSPEMIGVARAKAARQGLAVQFQIGLIESLAFPDASIDVVISSLMMHHLPDELKPQGLAEIVRVLKPGGRLLIVDFKRPAGRLDRIVSALFLHGRTTSDIQDMPPLLRGAGFVDIESGETGFRTLGFARCRVPS